LRGHVVNVASVQGKEGLALAGAYGASKAGLISLTKSAGKEAGPLGIMVNCVTPAAAETAMAKELTPARRADILQRIPLGRFIDVDEIARMVVFLCFRRLLILDRRGVRPVRRTLHVLTARAKILAR
jgi:NAD(P)-dependent dehydrogenase (short-subunit alcohol dehydrogenase family)